MSNTDINTAKSAQSPSPNKKFIANDHTSALVNLFSPQERYENSDRSAIEFLSKLLLEISVLKEKLAHPEQQDLYFRLGIESNKHRLISLKQQFNILRKEVNTADVKALLQEVNSIEEFLTWYKATAQTGFINEIVIHSKTSRIRHLQLIAGLKNELGKVKSLTHYLKIMI